jgi:hypothetical protein
MAAVHVNVAAAAVSETVSLRLSLQLHCHLGLLATHTLSPVRVMQSRIDSFFLRSSSRSSSSSSSAAARTVIEIDIDSDAPTDDERPPAKRLRSSRSAASSLSQRHIEQYLASPAAARSSSLPICIDDWQWDDEDYLPLSGLVLRSAPPPAVARPAEPVARRALSDISNNRRRDRTVERAHQRKAYLALRAQLAHPHNRAMCAYCGVREHSAIHHEREFRRAGRVSSSCCVSCVAVIAAAC